VFTELSQAAGENWTVTLSPEALELVGDSEVKGRQVGCAPGGDQGGGAGRAPGRPPPGGRDRPERRAPAGPPDRGGLRVTRIVR